MRFLFITDTHIRGTAPRNRKDNYDETLKNKLQEVGRLAERWQVDYLLHGGDWFDRPDISPAVVRDFAVLIRNFNKPFYTVAGNHDIFGHNPQTLPRTMLGLLEGLEILHLLDYGEEVILEKDGIRVQLTGSAYRYDLDGGEDHSHYIVKKRQDVDYAINMVHGMLLNRPFIEGIRYTLVDEIVQTEADITLAGHYHTGFGVIRRGERYFANPGSLLRITNAVSEMKRLPEVLLICLEDRIEIREIPLESALPGDEVLDRDQIENSQDRNLKIHAFYQAVSSTSQFKRMDLDKIVDEIASSNVLREEVRREAVSRIGQAKESLSRSGEEDS